ncbi:MAG: hypothetical protein HY906_14900, partial [Deltaproteobacteria bacterium]|nr:hypothetical protein [Deltaproteobacteria bacterium]
MGVLAAARALLLAVALHGCGAADSPDLTICEQAAAYVAGCLGVRPDVPRDLRPGEVVPPAVRRPVVGAGGAVVIGLVAGTLPAGWPAGLLAAAAACVAVALWRRSRRWLLILTLGIGGGGPLEACVGRQLLVAIPEQEAPGFFDRIEAAAARRGLAISGHPGSLVLRTSAGDRISFQAQRGRILLSVRAPLRGLDELESQLREDRLMALGEELIAEARAAAPPTRPTTRSTRATISSCGQVF